MLLLFYLGCWFGFAVYMYVEDVGIIIPKKDASTDCDADEDGLDLKWFVVVGGAVFFIGSGIGTFVVSLGLIQFAAAFCNFRNGLTRFLSVNAYAVYLFHPWIICPVAYSWSVLLHALGGPELVFCDGDNVSKTHFGHDYLVWIGWVYTTVVSLVIVWPIAWCIRRIPGMDKIM